MVLRQYSLCKMLIANVTNAWCMQCDGKNTAEFQFPCLTKILHEVNTHTKTTKNKQAYTQHTYTTTTMQVHLT